LIEAQKQLTQEQAGQTGFLVAAQTQIDNLNKQLEQNTGNLIDQQSEFAQLSEALGITGDEFKETEEEAKKTATTFKDLTNRQSELKAEIQDIKAAGGDATAQMKEYNQVTRKIEGINSIFKKDKKDAELLEGSLAFLRSALSGLQKDIQESPVELIPDLVKQADEVEAQIERVEGIIARARSERSGSAVLTLKTNIDEVSSDGSFNADAVRDRLQRRADAEAIQARNTISNTEELNETLKVIELSAQNDLIDERLKNEELSVAQELALRKTLAENITEIESIEADKRQRLQAQAVEGILAAASQIQDINSILATQSETRFTNELNALESRYEKEISLAEGNEARQAELESELAAKKEEIRKSEFNRQKRFRVAAAFTSLAEGIVNVLSAPTTIPDPFGALYKGFRVGILTATTAAQVAKINAQKAARGTLVADHASDPLGFFVHGSTHDDKSQGIPALLNGRNFLLEHGEFTDRDEFGNIAVINKRSSAAFNKQLRAIAGLSFPGKQSYLSDINSYKNYGVAFARDGALVPNLEALAPGPSGGGSGGTTIVNVQLSDDQLLEFARITGQAVEKGSRTGTMLGLNEATREAERQARADERAGIN
jgi:hypothetical protein